MRRHSQCRSILCARGRPHRPISSISSTLPPPVTLCRKQAPEETSAGGGTSRPESTTERAPLGTALEICSRRQAQVKRKGRMDRMNVTHAAPLGPATRQTMPTRQNAPIVPAANPRQTPRRGRRLPPLAPQGVEAKRAKAKRWIRMLRGVPDAALRGSARLTGSTITPITQTTAKIVKPA